VVAAWLADNDYHDDCDDYSEYSATGLALNKVNTLFDGMFDCSNIVQYETRFHDLDVADFTPTEIQKFRYAYERATARGLQIPENSVVILDIWPGSIVVDTALVASNRTEVATIIKMLENRNVAMYESLASMYGPSSYGPRNSTSKQSGNILDNIMDGKPLGIGILAVVGVVALCCCGLCVFSATFGSRGGSSNQVCAIPNPSLCLCTAYIRVHSYSI